MKEKKVYWQESVLTDNLSAQLEIDGISGDPALYGQIGKKNYYNRLDLIRVVDKVWFVKTDRDGGVTDKTKAYKSVPMGRTTSYTWSILNEQVLSSDPFAGVVLSDSEDGFYTWMERRDWVFNFLQEFRIRCRRLGIKREKLKVYIMVSDPLGITESWNVVDGFIIYPLNGMLNQNKFILPLGGYLDISPDANVEGVRDTIQRVSKIVNVDQESGEAYDQYVARLQFHVFNYEIKKNIFVSMGGKIEDFAYNDMKIDMEAITELAIIKGVAGSEYMIEIARDMEKSLVRSIHSGNSSSFVESLGKLYSRLLARVEHGMMLDSANNILTPIVSGDIRTALQYGTKLNEIINSIHEQKFREKVSIIRLKQEQQKIDLNKKNGGVVDDGSNVAESQILDMIGLLGKEDTAKLLSEVGDLPTEEPKS